MHWTKHHTGETGIIQYRIGPFYFVSMLDGGRLIMTEEQLIERGVIWEG